jgi:hypothetical protein
MAEFRFFNCQEVRCPKCGAQMRFLFSKKLGQPLLMQHETANCSLSDRKFYASPLVIELTEFNEADAPCPTK